jgi:hypothetical protein
VVILPSGVQYSDVRLGGGSMPVGGQTLTGT